MKKRIKPRNKVGKITIKGGNKLLIINFTFCGLSFLRCVRKGRKLRIFVNFIKSHEDYMNFVVSRPCLTFFLQSPFFS